MKMRIVFAAFAIIVTLTVAAAFAWHPYKNHQVRQQAIAEAEAFDIATAYDASGTYKSDEEIIDGLWDLAVWKNETEGSLDTAFGFDTDQHGSELKEEDLADLTETEAIRLRTLKGIWESRRDEVDQSVTSALGMIYHEGTDDAMTEDRETQCRRFFQFAWLDKMILCSHAAEDGDADLVFETCTVYEDKHFRIQLIDTVYDRYPETLREGCKNIVEAESAKSYISSRNLEHAAWFALRFDEDVEGLDELVLAYEKQEYDRKADFPWIGMTLEEAYDTKLGEPDEVTKDTGSWGHAMHEFGDLTWYLDKEADDRLCQAHYYDDQIERVIDYRNGQVTWYELQRDGSVKVTRYGEDPVEAEIVSEPEAAAEKETAETGKSSGGTKGSGGVGTGSGSFVGR